MSETNEAWTINLTTLVDTEAERKKLKELYIALVKVGMLCDSSINAELL